MNCICCDNIDDLKANADQKHIPKNIEKLFSQIILTPPDNDPKRKLAPGLCDVSDTFSGSASSYLSPPSTPILQRQNGFNNTASTIRPQQQGDRENKNPGDGSLYAITINLSPYCKVNRKQWNKYDHTAQKKTLERLLTNKIKSLDNVYIKTLTYEICPVLRQIHLHGLLESNALDIESIKSFFNDTFKPDFKNNTEKVQWLTCHSAHVHDVEGWLEYINKDI